MDLSATAPGGVSCQALRALTLIAKALFGCLVVLLPIGGAWAGGALAAMSGGPRWVPFVAAALVFPLLPLAWEAWAERRRRAAETVKAHILTLADRLLLRTLALSVVFLGVLLSASPRTLFDALCTRGDFVVEGAEGEVAARVGRGLLSLADTLDALYSGGRQHTFARPPEERRPDEPPTPSELNAGGVTPPPTLEEPPETGSTRTEHTTTQGADADVGRGPTAPAWPLEAVMHPLVLDLPADAERSWQAVARYLREHEPNDTRLVKALHDYLADRIAYDAVAYASGTYGDQRPDAVFARHEACAAATRARASSSSRRIPSRCGCGPPLQSPSSGSSSRRSR